jgi:NADP-dependent 3-hydroxy acid dehydrogenase YdfG
MQTVLITGAACGIGRDTARLLASAGWQCVLVAHNEQALKQVGHSISE